MANIVQAGGWNNPGIDPTTGQPYRQPMQTPITDGGFVDPWRGSPVPGYDPWAGTKNTPVPSNQGPGLPQQPMQTPLGPPGNNRNIGLTAPWQPMQTPLRQPSIYQSQAGQPSYINPSLYTGTPNSLGQYAVNKQYQSNVYKPFSNTASMLSNYFGTGTTGSNAQTPANQGLLSLGMRDANNGSQYNDNRAFGSEGSASQLEGDARSDSLSPIGMKGLAGLIASLFGGPMGFLMGNVKYGMNEIGRAHV